MSSPWSELTAAPALPTPAPIRRQTLADQSQVAQAQQQCEFSSGNNIISCFPTQDTSIPQHQWASFVWNSRRPELTQINLVDIFLFRADSGEQILHFPNVTNPFEQAGTKTAQVNDSWFGQQGLQFAGKPTPFPFYWVIIRSDATLDGTEQPQATFTAVQTTVLDSVAAASSSSAAAAAASSSSAAAAAAAASSSAAAAASLSSLSSSLSASASPSRTTPNPTGAVQHSSSSSSFPRWAIAVIVILGFLAIAASCILVFLILRRLRRARENGSMRNSIGSASPMITRDHPDMAQRYDAGSPLLPPPGVPGAQPASAHATMHDGASTISDSGGPFSGADAAIMADAFRKMLRKPDFGESPVVEGESPGEDDDRDPHRGSTELEHDDEDAAASTSNIVLSRELAEEGRDIRSVASSRGVRVESRPER